MKNVILKIVFLISFVLLVWTASIAVPIYFRGFYFAQIDNLNIVEESGATKEEIRDAYNEMLDYLTLHKDFSLGQFAYSEDGKAHFEDCRRLFDLNLSILIISLIIVITLLILEKTKLINLKMWGGFHACFYAGIFALILPLILAGICAIDFDKAFDIFHHIFFPGKSNWSFSRSTDPIITILPMEFFASCGVFIVCILAFLSIFAIVTSVICRVVSKRKLNKNTIKSS